jgi:hypothetical protein
MALQARRQSASPLLSAPHSMRRGVGPGRESD